VTAPSADADDDRRTAAQWTTLVISSLLLAVVVAVLVRELVEDRSPAAPQVELDGEPRHVGDTYVVDVVVTNAGDETAANTQVNASLDLDGEVTESDQVIDFLEGGAEEHLSFVFQDDPAKGDLEVEVASFAEP
jgi:uncharacterized protein (TIGR02588 family)